MEQLQSLQPAQYAKSNAPVPEGPIVVERGSSAQEFAPKLNRGAVDVVRFLLEQGEMVTATMSLADELQTLLNFASALAAGLLIGIERGWQGRNIEDNRLVAGIRTFALSSLLGAFAMLLSEKFGGTAWAVIFIGFAALVVASYFGELQRTGDMGLTSEVALLLTFLLGSLAMAGHAPLAAAGAVAVALLLSLKRVLHGALQRLSEDELSGTLKLLFISLVLLPVLPNEGYGPWQVFNPYATWWMVVLIAAIGFAAYVAIRVIGPRKGLLVTALLGGMVSSTAMTLTLARLDGGPRMRAMLACGLLATSALMFPRVLLEVGLVNPALDAQLDRDPVVARREMSGRYRLAYGVFSALAQFYGMQEYGNAGLRVNAIAPGPVETEMAKKVHTPAIRADYHDTIPLARYGSLEEIANAVGFLCSPQASYVNGQVLAVDGGFDAAGVGLPTLRKTPH